MKISNYGINDFLILLSFKKLVRSEYIEITVRNSPISPMLNNYLILRVRLPVCKYTCVQTLAYKFSYESASAIPYNKLKNPSDIFFFTYHAL